MSFAFPIPRETGSPGEGLFPLSHVTLSHPVSDAASANGFS